MDATSTKPDEGTKVWCRFKGVIGPWHGGLTNPQPDPDLILMGATYGNSTGGVMVSTSEIEWKAADQ